MDEEAAIEKYNKKMGGQTKWLDKLRKLKNGATNTRTLFDQLNSNARATYLDNDDSDNSADEDDFDRRYNREI